MPIKDATSYPPAVYHGMPCPATGDFLLPSNNYGTELDATARRALGVAAGERPPLVFASSFISKALAFTFSRAEKEVLFNAPVKGTDFELIMLLNRRKTMTRPRDAAVYRYSGDGYVPLPSISRQLVSLAPMPLSNTEKVLEIRRPSDAMLAGLQIFSMEETFDEIDVTCFFDDKEKRRLTPLDVVNELLLEGRAVWENHLLNINPLPLLAERFGYAALPAI